MNLDPLNTTEHDGAACALCGDDAVWSPSVMGTDTPLCGDCTDDHTTICPGCHTRLYQRDGVRLYDSPRLYCSSCAAPELIQDSEAASRADVDRDDSLRRG